MTAISRLPASIDAIIEAISAVEDRDFNVYDGPEATDSLADCVYIGYDGDVYGVFKCADVDQQWAGTVGAKRRDETLSIVCSVIATRGDENTKALRDTAYDILGVVESVLRANPGLGFSSPYVAGVRPRDFYYSPNADGFQARLVFTITVNTRV